MFTQTHVLAAWLIGKSLPCKERAVPLACVFGATLPDLALITQIVSNWSAGKPGEAYISPVSSVITQITHSIPMWIIICPLLILLSTRARHGKKVKIWAAAAFLLGILVIHIFVDCLTHKTIYIEGADYLWPWTYKLAPILGIWDYRTNHQSFIPRWPELALDAVMTILVLLDVWKWLNASSFQQPESASTATASAD